MEYLPLLHYLFLLLFHHLLHFPYMLIPLIYNLLLYIDMSEHSRRSTLLLAVNKLMNVTDRLHFIYKPLQMSTGTFYVHPLNTQTVHLNKELVFSPHTRTVITSAVCLTRLGPVNGHRDMNQGRQQVEIGYESQRRPQS